MKKGLIIGLSVISSIAIIVGVILAIVLSQEPFAKTDGVSVNINSPVASLCRVEASTEALEFFSRTGTMVVAYPSDKEWNLDEKIELSGKYTADGYPVYIQSWNGDYDGTPTRYECYIRTSKDDASILWLKHMSSKVVVKEDVSLYDEDGNELDSDN